MCIFLHLSTFLTLIEKRRQIHNLLTLRLTLSHIRLNAELSDEMKSVCAIHGENEESWTTFLGFLLISVEGESIMCVQRAVLVLEIL